MRLLASLSKKQGPVHEISSLANAVFDLLISPKSGQVDVACLSFSMKQFIRCCSLSSLSEPSVKSAILFGLMPAGACSLAVKAHFPGLCLKSCFHLRNLDAKSTSANAKQS